jgi:type IV pilus assembly protein PilY1
MYKPTLKAILLLCATAAMLVTSYAQVSQEPLLTRSGSAEPNLLLMFDDSGSMDDQFVYQYGGDATGDGRTGPGNPGQTANCPNTPSITNTCTYNAPSISLSVAVQPTYTLWVSGTDYSNGDIRISPIDLKTYKRNSRNYNNNNPNTNDPSVSANKSNPRWDLYRPPTSSGTDSNPYYELSPDVNRLYYDPRVTYRVRITSTGSLVAQAPTSTDPFYVFFYKNGTSSTTTTSTMVWPGTGNDPTLATSYLTSYTPDADALVPNATTGLSYPQTIATGTGPFPRFAKRTDCNAAAVDGGSCSLGEERQNYANWKKYHSNRVDLVKTGLGYAFQRIGATLRLGWGTINNLEGSQLDAGVSLFTAARKAAFYDWLYSQTIPGDTPNRKALDAAGKYFSRQDNLGPWSTSPDVSSTGVVTLSTSASDTVAIRKAHLSCRRSYSMLVTDGYYHCYWHSSDIHLQRHRQALCVQSSKYDGGRCHEVLGN